MLLSRYFKKYLLTKMKISYLIIILFLCVRSYSKWSKADWEKFGPFQLAMKSKLIRCDHDRRLDLDVTDIDVYFFDFKHNIIDKHSKYIADKGILSYPHLKKSHKFIFYVGDFRSSVHRKIDQRVKEAFKDVPNIYFVFFDHSAYTHDKKGAIRGYERSVKYTHYIGRGIAEVLVGLSVGGISPRRMHCIGHGLGAQILGHAGEYFIESTQEQIARITALDPSGLCFSNSLKEEQIRAGVADFVEIYHCNAGALGSVSVLGDVDFFVNERGQFQPNCKAYPLTSARSPKVAKCNHRTCLDIWLATIENKDWYLAWKCKNYDLFIAGECKGNHVTTAGYWIPSKVYGIYFISTDGYNVPFTKTLKKKQRS